MGWQEGGQEGERQGGAIKGEARRRKPGGGRKWGR